MSDKTKPEAPELSADEREVVEHFGIHPELEESEWVVHVYGPDDVLPARDMLDAIRQAHAINDANVRPGGYYGDATEPREHMTYAWACPVRREQT